MISLFDADCDSSDSDDVDYVPSKTEADHSEASDDQLVSSDGEEDSEQNKKGKSSKKQKASKKMTTKKIASGENSKCMLEKEDAHTITSTEKINADDVWKSFLEEVNNEKEKKDSICNEKICNPVAPSDASHSENDSPAAKNEKNGQVNGNVKVFEFAGETLSIKGDAIVSDAKASADFSVSSQNLDSKVQGSKPIERGETLFGKRKSGLNSVLDAIMNKKQKLNTLEKTLIDWRSYKKDEGIEEDLEKFNRGKGGFIERQRFLQRSDVRSFEVEKETRLSKVKKP